MRAISIAVRIPNPKSETVGLGFRGFRGLGFRVYRELRMDSWKMGENGLGFRVGAGHCIQRRWGDDAERHEVSAFKYISHLMGRLQRV